jgi:hypothetical protein
LINKIETFDNPRDKELLSKGIWVYNADNPRNAREADLNLKELIEYSPEDQTTAKIYDLSTKTRTYALQLSRSVHWHGKTREIRRRLGEVVGQMTQASEEHNRETSLIK